MTIRLARSPVPPNRTITMGVLGTGNGDMNRRLVELTVPDLRYNDTSAPGTTFGAAIPRARTCRTRRVSSPGPASGPRDQLYSHALNIVGAPGETTSAARGPAPPPVRTRWGREPRGRSLSLGSKWKLVGFRSGESAADQVEHARVLQGGRV